jgi:hypothetical protein
MLSLMAGVGHFAPWEQPQVFNQIVLDFLKEWRLATKLSFKSSNHC